RRVTTSAARSGQAPIIDIDAIDLDRVWVHQQLVRVKPEALTRIVRTVGAKAVTGTRLQAGHEGRVDAAGGGLERDAGNFLLPTLIENAHPHRGRGRRPHGETDAVAGGMRAKALRRGRFGHQVMTLGRSRPVRAAMPAISLAARMRSDSASCVSRSWRSGSGSKRSI